METQRRNEELSKARTSEVTKVPAVLDKLMRAQGAASHDSQPNKEAAAHSVGGSASNIKVIRPMAEGFVRTLTFDTLIRRSAACRPGTDLPRVAVGTEGVPAVRSMKHVRNPFTFPWRSVARPHGGCPTALHIRGPVDCSKGLRLQSRCMRFAVCRQADTTGGAGNSSSVFDVAVGAKRPRDENVAFD